MGCDRESGRSEENSRENEIGSRAAAERAVEKICEGRCRDKRHDNRERNNSNFDIDGRDNHNTNLDDCGDGNTRGDDDASSSDDSCTDCDCRCNFDTDYARGRFPNSIGTPRTIACPKRNTGRANDTECNAASNRCAFSGCERHGSFNQNNRAAGRIAACADRFASRRSDAGKIQIAGATVPTAKS